MRPLDDTGVDHRNPVAGGIRNSRNAGQFEIGALAGHVGRGRQQAQPVKRRNQRVPKQKRGSAVIYHGKGPILFQRRPTASKLIVGWPGLETGGEPLGQAENRLLWRIAVQEVEAVRNPNEEALDKEYYEILKIVDDFDGRLMTVKGWGVTLSLAALAWGFQYGHYGLFLVATLSGFGFWVIEGAMKRHQMRYYLRMREIEVLQYERISGDHAKAFSSPRIDSSWSHAGAVYAGKLKAGTPPVLVRGPRKSYRFAWFFPHVFLPHLLSVLAGLVLLLCAIRGSLGNMSW